MHYVADVSYDMLHIIYSIKRNSAKIKRNEPGLHETDFYSNTLFVIYSCQRTYMCITLFLYCLSHCGQKTDTVFQQYVYLTVS